LSFAGSWAPTAELLALVLAAKLPLPLPSSAPEMLLLCEPPLGSTALTAAIEIACAASAIQADEDLVGD
jgi:hypothetical protein